MPPRHVYVHVPFCARRCTYCDFSIAVRSQVPVDEYLRGLAAELDNRFPRDGLWAIDTLYLGGGTPSKLGARGVSNLLSTLWEKGCMQPAAGAEITIEANPEDVDRSTVEAWREAGVNRISLGAQSFSNDVLRWMHRTHDADAISRAVDAARSAGVHNVSLDLIFALPGNVPRDWSADVTSALSLSPSHLSIYGLTVEPASPLGKWRSRGTLVEATDVQYESEFLFAHSLATRAGYEHYEVSSYCKPGLRSRHNSMYWQGVEYAGLGPAAHEFAKGIRRWNVQGYAEWVRRVLSGSDPIGGSEELTQDNRVAEDVYLSLRGPRGLRLAGSELSHVRPWLDAGWGEMLDGNMLTLTANGWLRLDALAADLTVFRSHS